MMKNSDMHGSVRGNVINIHTGNLQLLLSRTFIYVGFFSVMLSILVPPLQRNGSFSSLMLIIQLLIGITLFIDGKKSSFISKHSILVLFVLLISFINLFNHGLGSGIGSLIVLAKFAFSYSIIENVVITKGDFKRLVFFSFVSLLIFPFSNHGDLNPNTLGSFIFLIGFIMVLPIRERKIQNLFFFFLFYISAIYFAFFYECRTALLSIFLSFVLLLTPSKLLSNKIVYSSLLGILIIGNILYVHFYIYASSATSVDTELLETYSNKVSETKKIYSGRQYIWQEALDTFHDSPLLGVGSKVEFSGYGSMNLHNSLMNIYVVHGAIVGILCILLMCYVLWPLRRYLDDTLIKRCIAFYFSFLLYGFSETLYSSTECVLCLIPIYIAYNQKKKIVLLANKKN